VFDFFPEPKIRVAPKDDILYHIPLKAIEYTDQILKEYADLTPSNEGLVYWAGILKNNHYIVKAVIAPETDSDYGRVSTSHKSNLNFVLALNELDLIQLAQVHSHPGSWVDHSDGDDTYAAFKIEGLVSIVVPEYSIRGLIPLTQCGIHRYFNSDFHRLSDKYVQRHLVINPQLDCILEDQRT